MHFECYLLIVWIALWIVNTYSEFQLNIFHNNRDITKCQSDDGKAIAIPRVFSENSEANKALQTGKNTGGGKEEEIALYEPFLLFPVFTKDLS